MITAPARQAAPSLPRRARDLVISEWTKLRSVRSTYWTLLVALVTPMGISAIIALAAATGPSSGSKIGPLLPEFISLEYAVLAVGVLGVLTVTAEFSTGQIRTTFATVPRRWPALAAKAAVTGAVTLVTGELVALASFFVVQALLSRKHLGISLTHPGVAGAVLAEGALMCVCALTGVGLGAMIRYTAGALAALPAVIFLPAVLALLPPPWNTRIDRFTLFYAADQVTALHPSQALFSPALSMLVLLAWPAAALLGAGVLLSRRDV